MMNVILLERIEKLGQMGDVVTVRPGYARNFLLPQKKAMRATDANKQFFEAQKAQLEAENLKRREEAESVGTKLDGLTFVLIRAASETGALYGSVSTRDVADQVTAEGFTISKSQVVMDKPIKELGIHPVRVQLHPEVSVFVRANVAKSAEEAEMQLAIAEGRSVAGVSDDDDLDDVDALIEELSVETEETAET